MTDADEETLGSPVCLSDEWDDSEPEETQHEPLSAAAQTEPGLSELAIPEPLESKLRHMSVCVLHGNRVENLEPLASCEQLVLLDMSHNQVSRPL